MNNVEKFLENISQYLREKKKQREDERHRRQFRSK